MYFVYMKSNLDFFNKSLIHQLFAHLDALDILLLHELREKIQSKVFHAVVKFVFSGVTIQREAIQKRASLCK